MKNASSKTSKANSQNKLKSQNKPKNQTKPKHGKIGIVIPIYNVAVYLRECLNSVLAQTHQDYEAVLVNDGSTDFGAQISGEKAAQSVADTQSKSLQIALEYAAKDSRFVVIDKENGGLSSARNAGIAYFMGEIALETRERERERERESKHAQSLKNAPRNSGFENKTSQNLANDLQSKTQNSANFTQNFSQIHAQSKTQNHIPQGLNEFFICGENPHKIHKIYTKATKNALSPAKIDYIIFLDSDDFWDKNCLAECLKAAYGGAGKKPDMVWFDWGTHFDDIASFGFPSWQEMYGYSRAAKENSCENADRREFSHINSVQFLQSGIKNKMWMIGAPWQLLVGWKFLQGLNIRFIDGIIWEDVLWCEAIFAHAECIALVRKKLLKYRVRSGATSGFENAPKKSLPPFVAPLARHFSDTNEAWKYFSAYSWAVSLAEFDALCSGLSNTHGEGFASEFCQLFAPYIIKNTLALFEFKRDPYGVKGETARLLGRFAGQIALESELKSRLKSIYLAHYLAHGNAFERLCWLGLKAWLTLKTAPKSAYKLQKRVINGTIKGVRRAFAGTLERK